MNNTIQLPPEVTALISKVEDLDFEISELKSLKENAPLKLEKMGYTFAEGEI